jgi:hypothetical protein
LGENFQNVPLTMLLGNCHYSKMVNFYNRKKSLEETQLVRVGKLLSENFQTHYYKSSKKNLANFITFLLEM